MDNLISPNDLGTILEHAPQRLSINELVRLAQKELKFRLVRSAVEVFGTNISLCTTQTRFNGQRLWFKCPHCQKRVGVLYPSQTQILGCRKCSGLKYKSQRYKGMIELSNKL